jgi:DNA-binding transcriptional ArsR family regulator
MLPPSRDEAPVDADDAVFGALAHATRREILVRLAVLGGELPSGYLAKRFTHSWPTTTRHLKVLEEAGLVSVHRTGRTSMYRLERERLTHALNGFLEHFAPHDPGQTWTSTGRKRTR